MNPKMLLTAAAFVQRRQLQHCRLHCLVAKQNSVVLRRAMTSSSSDVDDIDKADRFFEMEQRNWDKGFDAYDKGFGPLTRQTIPTLLSDGGFPPSTNRSEERPFKLLDVATGPGFVLSGAIDAAMKINRRSEENRCSNYHFIGLDITQNFLNMAKRRIDAQLQHYQKQKEEENIHFNIDFVVGSAESLPFDDESFDSIVCNFGILHFFHPDAFLRESFRVLRPGGRVCFSAWAPPDRTEGFRITLESIAAVGNPNVEGLPEGPNFFDFGDSNQAIKLLEDVCFDETKSVEMSEMQWTSINNGSELYDVMLQGTSRTREVLLGQTQDESRAIASCMTEKYATVTNSGKRYLAMPAVITSGRKLE